jgi:hypothetical protein
MIRHVVMFRWDPSVDDDHVAATAAALDRLASQVPTIAAYRHGRDLGLNEGNYDYVIVGDFETVADYETYRDHPDHRRLIADQIAGRAVERASVQYEF